MPINNKVRQSGSQFEDLTMCHVEQLYRLAYSRTGNGHDAEDIVQDTYLKAYRAFPQFRHETSVKNWLTQILLNTVNDHFRRNAKRGATVNIDEAADLISEPTQKSHEELCTEMELDADLAQALKEMPEALLSALLLREIHDSTYQEIATLLKCPTGTVMSRLSRARAFLRERLGKKVSH